MPEKSLIHGHHAWDLQFPPVGSHSTWSESPSPARNQEKAGAGSHSDPGVSITKGVHCLGEGIVNWPNGVQGRGMQQFADQR